MFVLSCILHENHKFELSQTIHEGKCKETVRRSLDEIIKAIFHVTIIKVTHALNHRALKQRLMDEWES